MFKIIIFGEEPRPLVLLAEQLERHVADAEVCGIIHQARRRYRGALWSSVAANLARAGGFFWRLLLGGIHGGRPCGCKTEVSSRRALVEKCHQAGWALHCTENADEKTITFIRERCANLTVVVGLEEVPAALENLTSHGMIAGNLSGSARQKTAEHYHDRFRTSVESLEVQVSERSGRGRRQLIRFEMHPDELDTDVSLRLKSNLLLRDLLVQSARALAQRAEDAAVEVEAWACRMISSHLRRMSGPDRRPSIDQAPPVRVRANWKLCIYSLFLLSPSVIFRNWVYRKRKRYPIVFLNSHLISDRHHRMALPTEAFLGVVRYLKKHYRIVGLSEACGLLKTGTNDQPTVVLTFDDGYEDNFVNLRAVCEELDVPVTLFISTDPVTSNREFAHDLSRGLVGFRALTWHQIQYWSAEDAEFHSHTCSHYDCGSTDEELLKKEMVESKRALEQQLGKPVTAFAFPFGKPENMSAPAVAIAASTYDHFLSSYGGENVPNSSHSHRHLLRKHFQGNAWESELEIQDVFAISRSARQPFRAWSPHVNKLGDLSLR